MVRVIAKNLISSQNDLHVKISTIALKKGHYKVNFTKLAENRHDDNKGHRNNYRKGVEK